MALRLIANWKLHGSKAFSRDWLNNFNDFYEGSDPSSIGIAPPSIFIDDFAKHIDNIGISIGAQNVDHFSSGARTGEISAEMVEDVGGKFSLAGHSERRMFFQETNADIAIKLDLISESSLIPIFCIGESSEEKQQNKTEIILEQQISEALSASSKLQNLIIAYEPIWAIGSGNPAEPEEINSIHKLIKDIVQSRFSTLDLQGVIYGGSVNIENAFLILKEEEVDGALVGGASLNGGEFAKIANIFDELKEL
ncbi:triose-phosphate isomerase [Gammaproteobacteria bacterium]|nr:triose-phosphate isomerase [Gammaproteobacteria bacterium]